jgi:recombinational DNA repair protein RecT
MSDQLMPALDGPNTQARFIKIFSAVNRVPEEKAEQHMKMEVFFFRQILEEKKLTDVTPLSAAGVFLEIIGEGLSCSPGTKHVYILKRSINVAGKGEAPKWEQRLVYQVSPSGKIYQAQKSGAIDDVTKAIIAYQGDEFWPEVDDRGNNIIHFKRGANRTKKIIGGFLFKIHKNGRREPFWLEEADIERLKHYSAKGNSKWNNATKAREIGNPNELYTSGPDGQIDVGFLEAKLISHALKNVRKRSFPSIYKVEEDEVMPEPDYNAPALPEGLSTGMQIPSDISGETPMHKQQPAQEEESNEEPF